MDTLKCLFNNTLNLRVSNSGGGGEVSPRKSVAQSASHYDVTPRVSGAKCSSKRRIKISNLSRIGAPISPGFGDFKVPIVIEN